jgi:membrane protein implicated in regulation of membrane protease activity
MKTTIRIAWLVAGTLLVARLAKAIIGYILWYGFGTTLWLPGRAFSFVPYLNGAALLAVSFAIVATCDWWIERRFRRATHN